jgi:hypothetical protein
LRKRDVLFGLGSSNYDWHDPFGMQTPAMVAEFETNLNHLRTREGMAKARANAFGAGVDLNPLDIADDDMAWLDSLIRPEHQIRRDRLRQAGAIAACRP